MASLGLRTGVGATDTTGHWAWINAVSPFLNKFDQAAPTTNGIWVWNGTLWAPMAPGAWMNTLGLRATIFSSSTGVWPNNGARTVPSGYTGPVIWDSQIYAGALQPAGMIEGDIWDERVP